MYRSLLSHAPANGDVASKLRPRRARGASASAAATSVALISVEISTKAPPASTGDGYHGGYAGAERSTAVTAGAAAGSASAGGVDCESGLRPP